ncbi:hypothetical protein WN943_003448 [Citrus x changshan-huyou]|uniref:phospholipase A1-II 7-like n=1 Tax=Citrus sinensis TaxID=2711 RepID=UPI002279D6D6|nr:phospholipase A1-II 7-like [Citrus sinensis]
MSITVSRGSVLATLNAADLVANGYYKPTGSDTASGCVVMTIVFASPRVGDSALRTVFEDQNLLRVLRITNKNDIVLDVPPVLFLHNLENYPHGIAGTSQGDDDDGFVLAIDRDISLVNKGFDLLNDKHGVPPNW